MWNFLLEMGNWDKISSQLVIACQYAFCILLWLSHNWKHGTWAFTAIDLVKVNTNLSCENNNLSKGYWLKNNSRRTLDRKLLLRTTNSGNSLLRKKKILSGHSLNFLLFGLDVSKTFIPILFTKKQYKTLLCLQYFMR